MPNSSYFIQGKKLQLRLILSAAAITVTFLTGNAEATLVNVTNTYNFSFTGIDPSIHAWGQITTSALPDSLPDGYDIVGITGFVNDPWAIDSLVINPNQPNSTNNGLYIYDNVLFPQLVPNLDNSGVLFTAGPSAYEFNIYTVGSTYFLSTNDPQANIYNPGEIGTFTLAVPELSTWAMFLIGFLGLGLIYGCRESKIALA
jgi:hypothetical protein